RARACQAPYRNIRTNVRIDDASTRLDVMSVGDDGDGPSRDTLSSAVSAACGPPAALAAVERARAQRSACRRAVRVGWAAPEPGLVSPAPVARRRAGVGAPEPRRRP